MCSDVDAPGRAVNDRCCHQWSSPDNNMLLCVLAVARRRRCPWLGFKRPMVPSFNLDQYATCCSKPITLMVQFVFFGIEQFPCYFIFVWKPSLVPSPLQSRSFLHGWWQLSASMGPSIKPSPANSCKSNYLVHIN